MTIPPRLLDAELDDFERALLSSARRDRGTDRARVRALAVWGALGTELATTTAAASTTASVASTAAALPTAVGLVKWLGAGIFLGTLSVGGITAVRFLAKPPAPAMDPRAVGAASAPESAAVTHQRPLAEARAELPSPPATNAEPNSKSARKGDTAAPAPVSEAPRPVSSGAFPLEAASSRLSEELAMLDRARQALGRHEVRRALAELAEYERRFPAGALSREATLLAVEARLENGDVAGARATAERALANDSSTPHAERLRALLNKGDPR